MVDSVSCLDGITRAYLVSRKHRFLGFKPLPGGIDDGSF